MFVSFSCVLLSLFNGNFAYSGTAVYRGVPLKKVLKIACGGVLPDCQHLEFIGADTYFKYVTPFSSLTSICILTLFSMIFSTERGVYTTTLYPSRGAKYDRMKKFSWHGR